MNDNSLLKNLRMNEYKTRTVAIGNKKIFCVYDGERCIGSFKDGVADTEELRILLDKIQNAGRSSLKFP